MTTRSCSYFHCRALVHCDGEWVSSPCSPSHPSAPMTCFLELALVRWSSDSQDSMIACFHVSRYVCQIHMGVTVVIARGETSLRGRELGKGKREAGGAVREENKNLQQLIVHKSSRSIVSGQPPTPLADTVPMNRSNLPHPLTSPALLLTLGGMRHQCSASPWAGSDVSQQCTITVQHKYKRWNCESFGPVSAHLQRN